MFFKENSKKHRIYYCCFCFFVLYYVIMSIICVPCIYYVYFHVIVRVCNDDIMYIGELQIVFKVTVNL